MLQNHGLLQISVGEEKEPKDDKKEHLLNSADEAYGVIGIHVSKACGVIGIHVLDELGFHI